MKLAVKYRRLSRCAMLVALSVGFATSAQAGNVPKPHFKPTGYVQIDLRNIPLPHPNPAAGNRLLSADDAQTYRALMARAGQLTPDQIDLQAASLQDQALVPVLHWISLRNLKDADQIEAAMAFLAKYRYFPRTNSIIARVEYVIDEAPADLQARWFNQYEPLTAKGHIAYGRHKVATGDYATGIDHIRMGWRDGLFLSSQERDILKEFGHDITPADHAYRLDRLLWNGQTASAKRQIDRADPALHNVAKARLALRQSSPGVDARVAAVPGEQQLDTGLIYERVRWRRQKGFDDGASELLTAGGFDQTDTLRPDRMWQERHLLARHYMADHDYLRAYALVKDHGMTEGGDFAQAEWLAGWLALRFLNDPKQAVAHFEKLHAAVSMPISKARAAYWAARAWQEVPRGKDRSQEWYQQASTFGWTYYGGLARTALGLQDTGIPAPVEEQPLGTKFLSSPMVMIIRQLDAIGDKQLARQFFHALLNQAESPRHFQALASLGGFLNRPDLALDAAKKASYASIILPGPAYPVLPLPGLDSLQAMTNYVPEPALITSIQRQESGFRVDVVSHAGARGLMQLMPATARKVASNLNINYHPSALVHNPTYNAMLGSAYLGEMIERFEGSYPLAVAAYNAGPHRVDRWLKTYGDPRRGDVDMIDWIEQIPFSETRNYVQRVLESVPVYRERLNTRRGRVNASLNSVLHTGKRDMNSHQAAALPNSNPRR